MLLLKVNLNRKSVKVLIKYTSERGVERAYKFSLATLVQFRNELSDY